MSKPKFQPMTKEIDELDRMMDRLDPKKEPEVPSLQEQIVYWQTARVFNVKRSVKSH